MAAVKHATQKHILNLFNLVGVLDVSCDDICLRPCLHTKLAVIKIKPSFKIISLK